MECIETEDASAFGAAMLGGVGAEIYPDCHSVPFLEAVSGHVAPDPECVAIYEKYFYIYNDLYPRLKESMHGLKEIQHA